MLDGYLTPILPSCAWNLDGDEAAGSAPFHRLVGHDPERGSLGFERFLDLIHPPAPLAGLREEGAIGPVYAVIQVRNPHTGAELPCTFVGGVYRHPPTGARVLAGCLAETAFDPGDEVRTLKLAVETAKLGIWRLDLQSGRLQWNDQMLAIYGLTRQAFEEDLGAWRDQVHPDDAHHANERLERAFEGQTVYDVSFRIRRPTGEVRHISASAAPGYRDGELCELVGINVDVTDQREIERALSAREGMYASLFDSSLAAIVVTNDRGDYIAANEAAARLFGRPVDQLTQMNVGELDFVGTSATDRFERYREAGRESGEVTVVRPDGEPRIARYRAVRVGPDLNLSVLMDITEERRSQLRSSTSQRLEALGSLAGGVAHDFNNLLSVIQGSAFLAREVEGLPDDAAAEIEEIVNASDRAAALVSQLLAFGRKQPARPSWVDVNRLVDEVERMLARVLGDDIVIETSRWHAAPPIWFDDGQLSQVMINLALNARDAMPHGGILRIRTLEPHQATTDLWRGASPPRDGFVVVAVEDTGAGIPAGVRDRVFEPFFTTKDPGLGTGLGLSTAYGIIRQHGGAIGLSSEPGQGTRFELGLPTRERESARTDLGAPARDRIAPADRVTGRRILVVEDQPALRRVVVRILTRAGHHVSEADDGLAALAACRDRSFDLVITDLIMPSMGGKALGERLATERPDLPVLYMSGYAETVDAPPSGRLLLKPLRPRDLLDAVEDAFESISPRN